MTSVPTSSVRGRKGVRPCVLMLLSNAYDPDPRVRQEALALIRMGCTVRILAWDRDQKASPTEVLEGVHVERVFLASKHGRGNLQVFFYFLLYVKMFWRAFRTSFEVIHCHDLDTLPVGFLLGKVKRTRVVYDAHESFPDMLQGSVHPLVLRAVERLEKFLIRRVDLVITVGEKIRRHFTVNGARRSVVVGNWKRVEEYSRTAEQNLAVRAELAIPDSALAVVCITNLLRDRKIVELLDAVEADPSVYAVLGGKGDLEPLIRERAARNPRIVYVGFVNGADIPRYTCAADIVYYGFDPKNPNASFSAPNKLYEALAAGRALITGNFGEIAEVVRNGECGVVLPEYSSATIGEAITTLKNSELRARFASNARRLGETTMNWTRGEETLFEEYSALLSKPLIMPDSRVSAAEGRP